eukprot:1993586-Prymnesium_polylepis.1
MKNKERISRAVGFVRPDRRFVYSIRLLCQRGAKLAFWPVPKLPGHTQPLAGAAHTLNPRLGTAHLRCAARSHRSQLHLCLRDAGSSRVLAARRPRQEARSRDGSGCRLCITGIPPAWRGPAVPASANAECDDAPLASSGAKAWRGSTSWIQGLRARECLTASAAQTWPGQKTSPWASSLS